MHIACKQIENTLIDLMEGTERRPLPTLTVALGYLTPEQRFLEWLFDPNSPPFDHIQGVQTNRRGDRAVWDSVSSRARFDGIANVLSEGIQGFVR